VALRPPGLLAARFVRRPNRFIVEADLAGGERVTAHLADPGRLRELLLPGVALRLRPATPHPGRRTRFTVALVRAPMAPRPWVSLDTTLPSRLAEGLLVAGGIAGVGRGWSLRREVRHAGSRFDFELRDRGDVRMLVEVKSVTLVEGGAALFPDAPTVRGTRHVRELTAVSAAGGRALVLFVVQRHDACEVRPNPAADAEFAAALVAARAAGVLLRAARFRLHASGRARWLGPLPVRIAARRLATDR
jgi:sugar fermentation stimulation protein A